mgnify:CR=1 FL=1
MEIKNIENLISKVSSNILDQLDLKPTYINVNPKSCLILVPNMGLGMKEYIQHISNQYQGYDLYLASKDNTTNLKDFNYVNTIEFNMKNMNFVHILDSVENIIILGMKINQMKSLGNADDEDDINQVILEGLLANKQINVMMNANEHIFNKLKKTFTDLRHIGIYVTNIHQVKVSVLDSNKEVEMKPRIVAKKEPDRSWGVSPSIAPERSYMSASSQGKDKACSLTPLKESADVITPSANELITESYVLKLKGRGLKTMILGKRHLITPLAKDKLREYKINIEYKQEAKS